MQKTISFCLVLFLLAGLFVSSGNAAAITTPTYEGEGFATPEEALESYLQAISQGDLNQALRAFAIETWVNRYDMAADLAWVRVYEPGRVVVAPNVNPLITAINVESRRHNIMRTILQQAINFQIPEVYLLMPQYFQGEDALTETKAFVENMETKLDPFLFEDLQIVSFVPPEAIEPKILDEHNQQFFADYAARHGAEECRSVIALLSAGGKTYGQCCDAFRYGEKWYLYCLGGPFVNFVGSKNIMGGLFEIER